MKNNIRKSENDLWWQWDEFCDNCGKQIRGNNCISSKEPDKEEKDYCKECKEKLKRNP